jgi:hypothetical protein
MLRKISLVFLMLFSLGASADPGIYIDQAGDSNNITVTQRTSAHNATVDIGKSSPADYNDITITQDGIGVKTAKVEIPSGFNNGINIIQDGNGNHYTGIQSLTGNANNITISQDGSGNHMFNLIGLTGTTNNANTITATQSGGTGADKNFTLNMNGTTGATVNVEQTNPITADSGSMSINCLTGFCGTYSYIKQ